MIPASYFISVLAVMPVVFLFTASDFMLSKEERALSAFVEQHYGEELAASGLNRIEAADLFSDLASPREKADCISGSCNLNADNFALTMRYRHNSDAISKRFDETYGFHSVVIKVNLLGVTKVEVWPDTLHLKDPELVATSLSLLIERALEYYNNINQEHQANINAWSSGISMVNVSKQRDLEHSELNADEDEPRASEAS